MAISSADIQALTETLSIQSDISSQEAKSNLEQRESLVSNLDNSLTSILTQITKMSSQITKGLEAASRNIVSAIEAQSSSDSDEDDGDKGVEDFKGRFADQGIDLSPVTDELVKANQLHEDNLKVNKDTKELISKLATAIAGMNDSDLPSLPGSIRGGGVGIDGPGGRDKKNKKVRPRSRGGRVLDAVKGGVGKVGGAVKGVASGVGRLAMGAARMAGPLAAIGLGAYSAYEGAGKAGEFFGKDQADTSFSEKTASGMGQIASDFTFGMVDPKEAALKIQAFFEGVGNAFNKGIEVIKTFFTETIPEYFMSQVKVFQENIIPPFKEGFEAVKLFFTTTIPAFFQENVMPAFNGIKDKLLEGFADIKSKVLSAYDTFVQPVIDKIVGIGKTIGTAIGSIVSGIKDSFMLALGAFGSIGKKVMDLFTSDEPKEKVMEKIEVPKKLDPRNKAPSSGDKNIDMAAGKKVQGSYGTQSGDVTPYTEEEIMDLGQSMDRVNKANQNNVVSTTNNNVQNPTTILGQSASPRVDTTSSFMRGVMDTMTGLNL